MNTGFPDEVFDVVWAIESFCYAPDRKYFLTEAYRILKRGGRIIIADGFDARNGPNIEARLMKRFLDGFALQSLALWEGFGELFQEVGFRAFERIDMTEAVKRSSRVMWWRAFLFTLILPFFYLFG
ncbi:MAG: Methyltransferase, UbiE/COQ5 family, partial [Candidatus Adlerbacteria bacterium GW2011_GWC1_50_9]